jgi:uncharacterized protein YjbJ (UPF0337 family)
LQVVLAAQRLRPQGHDQRGTEWPHGHPSPSKQTKGNAMNKDQVKGTLKDSLGKVQEKAGHLVGSAEQQRKGIAKQIEGKSQKAVGDVEEAVKDIAGK